MSCYLDMPVGGTPSINIYTGKLWSYIFDNNRCYVALHFENVELNLENVKTYR